MPSKANTTNAPIMPPLKLRTTCSGWMLTGLADNSVGVGGSTVTVAVGSGVTPGSGVAVGAG